MDIEDPSLTQLLTDKDEPKFKKSRTDIADPSREKDLNDMEEPKFTKLTTDSENTEPKRVIPSTETAEPIRL